jgi:hypothetical protein
MNNTDRDVMFRRWIDFEAEGGRRADGAALMRPAWLRPGMRSPLRKGRQRQFRPVETVGAVKRRGAERASAASRPASRTSTS